MHLILPLLLAIGFVKQASVQPDQKQVQVGQTFTLQLSEQVQVIDSLSDATAILELVSVSDNRCPLDVRCIQAGDVTVMLQMKAAGGAPAKRLELSKAGGYFPESNKEAVQGVLEKHLPSVTFGSGYRIVLLEALPYPEVKTLSRASKARLQVQHVQLN